MSKEKRLRIAIQKSGRLGEDSRALLRQSGIVFSTENSRLLVHAENLPVDILLARSCDIPGLVMDNVVDLGMVGENTLEEVFLSRQEAGMASGLQRVMPLGFGPCRLSIAIPESMGKEYRGPESLEGKRIATSYPRLLNAFMKNLGIRYSPCLLNGSVEVAPRAELADAVCDIVSTGSTLEANGLKEVEVVLRSQAVLVQKTDSLQVMEGLEQRLISRMKSVIQARESKYIMMHVPRQSLDEVIEILPCAEKPTILQLASSEMTVALHVVTRENLFWKTMEALKDKGCSSILVLPVEKMME